MLTFQVPLSFSRFLGQFQPTCLSLLNLLQTLHSLFKLSHIHALFQVAKLLTFSNIDHPIQHADSKKNTILSYRKTNPVLMFLKCCTLAYN